jgi:hypothetical protein
MGLAFEKVPSTAFMLVQCSVFAAVNHARRGCSVSGWRRQKASRFFRAITFIQGMMRFPKLGSKGYFPNLGNGVAAVTAPE